VTPDKLRKRNRLVFEYGERLAELLEKLAAPSTGFVEGHREVVAIQERLLTALERVLEATQATVAESAAIAAPLALKRNAA
jgi:hypothetical protein